MFVQCFEPATDQRARSPLRLIARPGIAAWLREHAGVAVRLLVAPPGFGKTTALAAYVPQSGRRCIRLALDASSTADDITAAVHAARSECTAGESAAEIVFDDAHLAAADVLAALNACFADPPPGVFFIVASQRRDVFDVATLLARGAIAVCDQRELAFSATDARALFAAQSATATPDAIEALVARCDGWPIAIAGTVSELLRAPQSTAAAYECWRQNATVPGIDLVNALLERVPFPERAAARRHFSEGVALDGPTLTALHRCGFFVILQAGTFALMRCIDELFPAVQATRSACAEQPVLEVELFGRFTASVAGIPIVWARRRDAHIIKYLLLRPDGSATRAELADVFWPQTARPLAMQNLRTACSTIRRAIGNVVGMPNVDAYLVAGERLTLKRAAIACDVDRFRQHVALAEAGDEAGSPTDVIAHLRAAEALYRTGLFAGDVSDPVFRAETQELAATYARVLERLSGALIERGLPDAAREYAVKALKSAPGRSGASRPHVHLRFAAS